MVITAHYLWVRPIIHPEAIVYTFLDAGHPQPEHETRHGSMTATRWAIDGEDEAVMELNGRRFSANDDGAPMMCSLVCKQMGRHVHIDFCRATDNPCSTEGAQHIRTRMLPSADRPKDFITHNLYWRRSGMPSFVRSLRVSSFWSLGFKGTITAVYKNCF